jgi:predicted dehydrogenase
MLNNEDLDAVAIAVTPSAQYNIAKKAIEKGLHVFAEKPLTANYKEAKELLTLAKKKKITTVVDFIFPEINEWQKAKELLDKEVCGKLRHVAVDWDFLSYDIKNNVSSWKTDSKKGGGALAFYGSHVLYYIEYFAGEIKKQSSLFSFSKESRNGAETGVDVLLNFKNKITGRIHISCNARGLYRHSLTFLCEDGTIVLESLSGVVDNFKLFISKDGVKKSISVKKDKKKNEEDERVVVVKKLTQRFVKGCTDSEQVAPSFKEGVRVQKLIAEIKKKRPKASSVKVI